MARVVRLYRLTLDAPARNTQPRYNIGPTTNIDAVIEREGKRVLLPMHWGLVSSWWSKPLKEMRVSTFNARTEAVAGTATVKRRGRDSCPQSLTRGGWSVLWHSARHCARAYKDSKGGCK